ncbi:hypothetical protein FKM82_014390 [Ascaphus truei]
MEEAEVPEYYGEEEEEEEGDNGFCDFEPLPTLLEDEENVSLADILSLRDNGLTEQDIWAICLECCYSMKSISHSNIFQTLCITPDTLAFNANGNVCFMEQLSDDPEGAFVPPEFDLTGNTLEAHIYSLGATLKAAIEFVIEPELETQFCQDLNSLLDLMQQENPVDRPDIESIISLCEEKMNSSSSMICRSLSAIGRRVLSIESVSTFQDGWENLWKGRSKIEMGIKSQTSEKGSERTSTVIDNMAFTYHPGTFHNSTPSHEEEYDNGWRETEIAIDKECPVKHSLFGNHLKKNKGERTKGSCYEKCNSFAEREQLDGEMIRLAPKKHSRHKQHTSTADAPEKGDFSQLRAGAEMATLKSWPSVPSCLSPNTNMEDQDIVISGQASKANNVMCFVNSKITDHSLFSCIPMQNHRNCDSPLCQSERHSQVSGEYLVAGRAQKSDHSLSVDEEMIPEKYATSVDIIPNSTHFNDLNRGSKVHKKPVSIPVYHEDSGPLSRQVNSPEFSFRRNCIGEGDGSTTLKKEQQWIPLKDVLLNYGKPLNEDQLWALCHECLDTLQTYIDYPAFLGLESVFIDNSGEVIFAAPQNEEPYDAFCVPPEFKAQGPGTEKACVYGIAAILWSAAKHNVPPNQKLALPKKLKRFLLHMAKRNADERPTLADSLQICRKYLLQRGGDSKIIWARLSNLAYQSSQNTDPLFQESISFEPTNEFSEPSSGFVPVSTNGKLMAVKGPVPLKDEPTNLPAAFTSPATYFKPIIIMQNADASSKRTFSYAEQSVNVEKKEIKEVHIGVNDIEIHADEDKTCQILNSCNISSKTQNSNTWDSSISDCSSDRKEKVSSAASSISSTSSTLPSSPIINNYLLKQDPKTGILQLVRVQLTVPEHIPSIFLETEPESQCIGTPNTQTPGTMENNDVGTCNIKSCDPLTVPFISKCNELQMKVNDFIGHIPSSNVGLAFISKDTPTYQGVEHCELKANNPCISQETAPNLDSQTQRTMCSPLQNVVHLIRDEFAFDGYLENGVEDLAMGLQYVTFCGAVCEKFCDLYWDDQLLDNLYKVVNGKAPPCISTHATDASYQCNPAQNVKKIQRKSKKYRKQRLSSTNEHTDVTDSEEILSTTSHQAQRTAVAGEKEMNTGTDMQVEAGTGNTAGRDSSFDELDLTELTEKDHRSQTPGVQTDNKEQYMYRTFLDRNSYCLSPEFTEENEENSEDSIVKHRDSSLTMSICPTDVYKCSPGWCSAFYGAQLFDSEVQRYVNILGGEKEKCSKNIEAKRLELEQQLMIETKNYRKTIKFYQSLLLKGKRNKGSDVKEMLPKLKGHLEEMKSKVQFLELAKKLLQVSYAEQWGLEQCELPTVANLTRHEIELNPSDDSSFLLIYNEKGQTSHSKLKSLQAGTPLGLMVYLYSSNVVLDGYVQQFLYTFRYFCTQEDLLQFLIDRINNTLPRGEMDSSPTYTKIYQRALILLQTWIEDCWHTDFSPNPGLLDKLEDLINSQILPRDDHGEYLMTLLQEVSNKKYTISSPSYSSGDKKDDTKSLHSLCTKLSEDNVSRKSFNWKLSKGNGPNVPNQKDKPYTIASAIPRPCYPSFVEEFSLAYIKADERGTYSVYECSVHQISSQLTLIQEEMFQKSHPVHFLNSRALGVKDKSTNVSKTFCLETLPGEVCSLFLPNCTQEKYMLQLLRFADNVSTWVSAEIVTCHTSKLQASILTKFLLIAKLCYEQRDFATAVQILGGLENLIVRQLPVWKSLPSKVSEILEELKAVEVFLKSDSLCLMKGDRFRTLPTIPSAYLLAMHVQQLETGGFTMANGAFKWNKLRNIAKVVSQVHAFQEIPYSFTPDPELKSYLRQRIAHFSDADISVLAADNNANFHHMPSEKHSRKIQDTLRRMKATFQ